MYQHIRTTAIFFIAFGFALIKNDTTSMCRFHIIIYHFLCVEVQGGVLEGAHMCDVSCDSSNPTLSCDICREVSRECMST